MARIAPSGTTWCSPHEGPGATLSDIVDSLGFAPLGDRDAEELRSILAVAIGTWSQDEGRFNIEGARLDVADLVRILKRLSKDLRSVSTTLRAAGFGLSETSDHDLEVIGQLSAVLGEDPNFGSSIKGREFLFDYAQRSQSVAHASDVAMVLLKQRKGTEGPVPMLWHDEFTKAVLQLCILNDVAPTLVVDRVSGARSGKFLDVAASLEKLLHPRIRAASRTALAQRLTRSKKRLKTD
jgi:hypothetical protein